MTLVQKLTPERVETLRAALQARADKVAVDLLEEEETKRFLQLMDESSGNDTWSAATRAIIQIAVLQGYQDALHAVPGLLKEARSLAGVS